MSKDTIYREDAIEAVEELNAISFYELNEHSKEAFVEIRRALKALPSADRPQGEWIDKAISIIDDMQREDIVDYEQAKEFRMRARLKGTDDES